MVYILLKEVLGTDREVRITVLGFQVLNTHTHTHGRSFKLLIVLHKFWVIFEKEFLHKFLESILVRNEVDFLSGISSIIKARA